MFKHILFLLHETIAKRRLGLFFIQLYLFSILFHIITSALDPVPFASQAPHGGASGIRRQAIRPPDRTS